MMKKIYLSILAGLLYSASAFAQPVLTAANTNPVIGESFQFARDQNVAFTIPSTGANQTWNYSTLTSGASMTATASSAAGGLVPTASLKLEYIGGSTSYYNTSTTELAQAAIAATGVEMLYSNNEVQMKYPFQMGSSNTDTWKNTFTSGSLFIRTGTTTITATGYGTLILPTGTYSNVLLVHFVQVYDDSTSGMQFVTYNNDMYMFYKPGNHLPILALSNLSTTMMGNTTVLPSYYYMSSGIVSSVEDVTRSLNLDIYPNPSRGAFQVRLSDKQNLDKVTFLLTDMVGRVVPVKVSESNNLYSIEVRKGQYATGIHQLAMLSNGVRIANKVIELIAN